MNVTETPELIRISGCEVCGGKNLETVLDLGSHPLCDDLIPVGDPRRSLEYPIELSFCPTCRTVHQNWQIPKKLLFPNTYHYRARHTADVIDGMRTLVQRCEAELGSLKGITALDIGCNDGSLLSIMGNRGCKTIGIEPTGAASDARDAGHLVYEDYLTPNVASALVSAHGHPDVITFTNVFAHIENLPDVISSLKILLGKETLLVIENHYLGAVLDKHQFDTFYHEHPRTYSKTSFDHIARSLELQIVATEFPSRYGGNIRVLMRNAAQQARQIDSPDEEDFQTRLRGMQLRIPRWRDAKRQSLAALVAQHGPLPAKAFPGRAAILIKLLDLDQSMVSAVYEKPGSMKIGHYVPGTRIPIMSDNDFATRLNTNAPLLNFAWHINAEIHSYMRKSGFDGEIVDIFSQAEFEAA